MSHSSTQTDTIYLSNVRFDSVYVSHERTQDYRRANEPSLSLSPSPVDTVVIKDVFVEYRYQLLRDTVERIKTEVIRDSIPYEVRVVDIKEVPRQRTWFDKLCYCCFGILILLLGFRIGKFLKPLL